MYTISDLLIRLEEKEMLESVKAALDDSAEPLALIEELRSGMTEVGRRFEEKEYYLSELVMSAEMFRQAAALIEPRISGGTGDDSKGVVVIGTVKGDIHDIGKNIVSTLLRCSGLEVHDLGVDVPPAKFVEKVTESGTTVLALSGLLTVAFEGMKETVEALEEAGLRDRVRVLIGGGPVDQSVVDFTGADTFGKDAAEAVRLVGSHLGR